VATPAQRTGSAPPAVSAPLPAAAAAAAPPARSVRKSGELTNDVVAEDTGDTGATELPATGLLAAAPPRDEPPSARRSRQVLIDKLATFKIEGEIVGMTTGPVVTQFEVSPAPGVKVARIANLEADLALAMRAPSVRIVAPIPGKAAVGVEVPNPEPEMVFFREVIESPRSAEQGAAPARARQGHRRAAVRRRPRQDAAPADRRRDRLGQVGVREHHHHLARLPHSPRTLRLLMVDPKMVELSMYNDLPHLRHPVVTDNARPRRAQVGRAGDGAPLRAALGQRRAQPAGLQPPRGERGQLMRTPEPQGDEGDPDRFIYRVGRCRTSS
jgi:DNA segregation ATPase FtsK/SpoIIIE, S-DNA-T family